MTSQQLQALLLYIRATAQAAALEAAQVAVNKRKMLEAEANVWNIFNLSRPPK